MSVQENKKKIAIFGIFLVFQTHENTFWRENLKKMTKKLDFQQNKFYFWRENSTYFPKNSPIFPRFFFVSLEFFA